MEGQQGWQKRGMKENSAIYTLELIIVIVQVLDENQFAYNLRNIHYHSHSSKEGCWIRWFSNWGRIC